MNRYDRWENYVHPDAKIDGIGCTLIFVFLFLVTLVFVFQWDNQQRFKEITKQLDRIEEKGK